MSAKPKLAAAIKQDKDPDQWKKALEDITINEQDWYCMIIMIIETLPEHTTYIEFFDDVAEEGSRKAIYSLTYRKVINSIKTLSTVDQDKCPAAQGVFHHVNKLISKGELLTASLIAKLVKYLVYRAKLEAISRSKRESNYENEVNQDIRAMLNVGKVDSQRSMKPAKTKKSAESLETKLPEKVNTHLRKIGEEWKDKVYIDDEPKDGPDLYIILTGFRDPTLPLELLNIGVPLTCILKIKRPGEAFDIAKNHWTNVDKNYDETLNVAKNSFSRADVTMEMIHNFWWTLDESCNDPKIFDDFSSIVFRTFCPPELPGNDNPEEAKEFKKDLYDRISCIVYDLHDLHRLHADYIRNMKIVNIPKGPEFLMDQNFNVYKSIMDSVPAECSFVAVILQAMLAQIEADLTGDETQHPTESEDESAKKSTLNVDSFNSNRSTHQESFGDDAHSENSTDQLDDHRKRLQKLNFQHGITKSKDEQPEMCKSHVDVILEDDELRLKTYHVHLNDDVAKLINRRTTSLSDLAMRSFQEPKLIDLWKLHKNIRNDTIEKNRHYINKLADCFHDSVDPRSVVHYLHLQVFDGIIHCHLNRAASRSEDRRISIIGKGCSPGATRSEPLLLSSKTVQDHPTCATGENPISNLRGFESDSIIDYGKTRNVLECPELFALTDSRGLLRPGFLEWWNEKLYETENADPSGVEFKNVRILSANVFLQLVSECFRKFKNFHSRYVEMTDSILLYFGKEEIAGHDEPCDSRVIKIVTPVCLRNFCEYVVREEDEWIRETENERTNLLTTDVGELTRKLSHHNDIDTVKTSTFTDNDFILPNSLKGQARRGHQETSLNPTETFEANSQKLDGKSAKDINDEKGKKKKSAPRSSGEKISKDAKLVDIESSSLPARKVSSLRCARPGDPYKFVGYDLGNRRVQITTRSETFTSADGTLVQVDSDEWIYRKKLVGIGIYLSGCYLKVEHMIGVRNHDQTPFHLITKNGIVMAFMKRPEDNSGSELHENCGPRFDFRASWPSGLSVEPVEGDSFKNSFYIRQRYISKGPKCEPVSRENYRKFLRNGTVLKFLDDDAVEVMRPNGTIVRCLKFGKFPGTTDSELEHTGELTKGEIVGRKKSRSLMSTRGQRNASSPRRPSRRTFQNDQNMRTFTVETPLDSNNEGIRSSREEAARTKITQYTALEHDGRHYEVVNNAVSRVFDASLVRTSENLDASEKLTRREDGTQSIFNSMGELVVSFPDGTRITTGFVIEDEPLICDWSDDEFNKFYGNNPGSNSHPNEEAPSLDLNDGLGSYRSAARRSNFPADRLRILLVDAFVSILMTCRMEHECYATVAYGQADQSCKLSMPDEVVIAISEEGLYDIGIGRNIELRISNDNLIYLSKFYENGRHSVSTSTYYLRQPKLIDQRKRVLLETTDSLNNAFRVYADGSVIRENRSAVTEKNSPDFKQKEHRLFAMNRDFTAYEYLDKSTLDEYQKKTDSDKRSSAISIAIPAGRTGLEYRLFLNPLEPTNYSKMWLHKVTYDLYARRVRRTLRYDFSSQLPDFRSTNHDGTDLSRSTYSTPYDWLFPFRRCGNRIRKNTWKVPIVESIQEGPPGVLTLTVFQEIAEQGKNVFIELQEALARYCPMIKQRRVNRTPSLKNQSWGEPNWVHDLALGVKTNIPVDKYLSGISTNRPKIRSSHIPAVKTGRKDTVENEEMLWYKKCNRERIILPYFESIQGSCFLWIMSCVDMALEVVDK